MRKYVSTFLLIILAAIILGSPSLAYPFGRDQGEYAWIASSAIKGHLAYRDIFNVKPPLTHMVHQVALLLFGYNMASIRIFDLIWQTITAILLFMIAEQSGFSPAAGGISAILYLFSYYKMDFWMSAQTDGFLNLPIAIGILFFIQAQQTKTLWQFILSGAMLGTATLFKYPIGILLPLLLVLVFVELKKEGLRPVLSMGMGFLAPLGISAFVMMVRGNFADFLWIQSTYIPRYSTISQNEDLGYFPRLGLGLLSSIISPTPGWVSAVGWYGIFKSGYTRRRPMTVIAAWWVSAVIHFVIQNKFYEYHALPILAPLALMVGNLLSDAFKPKERVNFTLGVIGSVLLISTFFLHDFPAKYIRFWNVVSEKSTLENVYGDEEFNRDGPNRDFSSKADIEVAKYLMSNTGQNEKIFIWGFEPEVYFLSQRENSTRFIYNFPLYGPNASTELRDEFIKEIKKEKPIYIVILKNDNMFHVTATNDDSLAAFNSFDEFHEFVSTNYHYEMTIEDFVLYKRKP